MPSAEDFLGIKPQSAEDFLGSAQAPNTAIDAAMSAGSGLLRGAAGLVGQFGDLVGLDQMSGPARSMQRLTMKAKGLDPQTPVSTMLPSTNDIMGAVTKPFGGEYQPKTTAGDYAKTISSFWPAAMSPTKASSTLNDLFMRGTRVAVPAVASETAGQLPGIKGTSLEPWAKFGGALVGGLGQGLGEGIAAERAQSAAIPTTDQLENMKNQEYQRTGPMPVQVTPQATSALNDRFGEAAIRKAIQGAEANRETGLANELRSMLPQAGQPYSPPQTVTTEAADKISQAFNTMAGNAAKTDRNIARGLGDRRADVETAVQQTPGINTARELNTRFRKSQLIDETLQDVQNTRLTAGGTEQAMRVTFGRLMRSRDMERFTPEEQDAIRNAANGTLSQNVLNVLGKFSPHGFLNTLFTIGAGHATGGIPGAIGALTAGEVARQGASLAATRNARLVSEMVRSGGQATPQISPAIIENLVRAGVLGRPQAQQPVPLSFP